MGKYIFVTGAPGSKLGSLVKNIYHSPDVDRGDHSPHREWHSAHHTVQSCVHVGAHWGPGMEFGQWFDQLDQHSVGLCEAEFDRPWTATAQGGVRLIKSHMFTAQIDFLRSNWPSCPVVLTQRADDACLGHWVQCGEFRCGYPRYHWYEDLDNMAWHIAHQNRQIMAAAQRHGAEWNVVHVLDLCEQLQITPPVGDYWQHYAAEAMQVAVLK